MRRKKQNSEIANDRDLWNHIDALGLSSVQEYRQWCVDHGFGKKLQKHWKHRCRERSFVLEALAQKRLGQKKQETRNPLSLITAICHGKLKEDDVTHPHLKRLCKTLEFQHDSRLEGRIDPNALLRLITHLYRCRTKFFDNSPAIAELGQLSGNTYAEAIALTASHAKVWIRPVEDWKPRTHNVRKQFSSLLRHLFAKYEDVPLFFDSVWFGGRNKGPAEQRGWFLHVAQGHNIRKCKLPTAYTKKMAHHFLRAPDDATVLQALRWGQIHALGGDERLTRAVFATRLAESFMNDEFWLTVLRWFIAHPMLDRSHVGPIIDYLQHQRFESGQAPHAPGQREQIPPREPRLTMQGRTPESLLRKVHAWHTRLANDNTHQIRQWQSSGIQGFESFEGTQNSRNLKCWTIRELLGSKALVAEGRRMKHCVATYASSCATGHSSIWTMEVESFEGISKLLTIEVRNKALSICQARGKLNRLPSEKERGILRRWAAQAGLKMASFT